MLRSVIDFFRRNLLFICMIIICLIVGFIYVMRSARNIVFMDFWRNTVTLIPPVINKNLTFSQLWKGTIGQRNFLQMSLTAFDIKYLSLNCIWEVYAGIIMLVISIIVIYIAWTKILRDLYTNVYDIFKQLLFLPIIFACFNLNQWEILSLQFSFAFMLRVFSYLMIFYMIDRALQKEILDNRHGFLNGIFTGIIICLLSQLYFPAMLFSIYFTFIVFMFLRGKNYSAKLKFYTIYSIPVVFSIILYFFDLPLQKAANGAPGLSIFFSSDFILAIFYMLSASLLPQMLVQKMAIVNLQQLGALLVLLIFFAIYLFFKTGMYKKTFFPFLISGYGIFSMPIIIYARSGNHDLLYYTSSRYVCETTFIWIGCALVFSYAILQNILHVRAIISILSIIIIMALVGYSNKSEYNMSVFRGEYKDQLIEIMKEKDINQIDDKTLQAFQAPPDLVRDGLKLLKQYQLNVYR